MKVVILAGGYGTRLGEETGVKPKPMVEIGGKPILWHIMRHYSHYGFNEFIILCGYKGNAIKQYFADYFMNQSSVVFDLQKNSMETIFTDVEPWKVTCLDTGLNTMTGGRIKKTQSLIGNEPFLLTYGDGLSNIDIKATVESHLKSKKICTMSAVQPMGRFGVLGINEKNELIKFTEKPQDGSHWINGGFFVCNPSIFDYLKDGDKTIFEQAPLETLTHNKEVNLFQHHGFWKCMDTLADKENLEKLWQQGNAPWAH